LDTGGFPGGGAVMNGFSSFRNVTLVIATLVGGYLVWTAYANGPGGLLRHSVQSVGFAIR
jgi:hypothetical protein